MNSSSSDLATRPSVYWIGDIAGDLILLDQTKLPGSLVSETCKTVQQVWTAIKQLKVRGAPAIGIAAGFGVVVAAQVHREKPLDQFRTALVQEADYLATSRPTAVNLFWALDRMKKVVNEVKATSSKELSESLLKEALAIQAEDRDMCHAIGRHGATLFKDGDGILTHCNAGGLATAEYGTALAVIFTCQDQGKKVHVFVDETRPLLQGARLTAWELQQRKVPATLICDNMAGQVMKQGKIQGVVVGADRIAANGDAANKIGTYGVAVLAAYHKIPFYVAAPSSTFDLTLADGSGIPIEERNSTEITEAFGVRTAPEGIACYNPAFDVTPASLIRGIITEKGVISPVTTENVKRVLGSN